MSPQVAIIVPMRPDGGPRDRLWAWCRQRWEQRWPDWPIYEGLHLDGPFNRSAAVNAAVAAADADGHGWDCLLIIDSDVVCNPGGVDSAVEVAVQTNRMVVAHRERVMLNQRGTERVLAGYEGSWRDRTMVEHVWKDSVSCAVAVSRHLWQLAGPFDEGFVGWGREDTAFLIACEAETGPALLVEGETFHLWHPPAAETNPRHPGRQANERRHQAYVAARGNREAVRALRRADVARPEPSMGGIPPILHRTVPEHTTDQVEAWWQHLVELHPDWEHRTWREPLDPADWPLTGDLFDRCQNGAQKAGLVRLEALVTHGGVYVDSDVVGFRPLDPLLGCQAFAGWEDDKVLPDAVLGARPGHPAFVAALQLARARVEAGADAWTSGPGVTTELLPGRADVLVLPPGSLYPFHYLEQALAEQVNANPPPWAYVAHQWHHSWGTEAQKAANAARQRPVARQPRQRPTRPARPPRTR